MLLRLPFADQWSVLWLISVVSAVEVMLRIRPLPQVASMLGVAFAGNAVSEPSNAALLVLAERDRRRLRCVRRILRYWYFCDGPCLREALVSGYVLRRYGPRLMIGVDRRDGAFAAHAWLDVQGRVVGDPGLFRRLE